MEDSLTSKNGVHDSNQHDSPHLLVDGKVENIDDDS